MIKEHMTFTRVLEEESKEEQKIRHVEDFEEELEKKQNSKNKSNCGLYLSILNS